MNERPTDPDSGPWLAWWKPTRHNSHWIPIAAAESYDRAADLAHDLVDSRGHVCVTPQGTAPASWTNEDSEDF
jgi:hypothetical protein